MAPPTKQPIDPGIIARVTNAWKALTGAAVVDDGTGWMGPLNPIQPQVPPSQMESVVGRQFDYPTGYNTRIRPRGDDAVSFQQMRALADSCDILRLVIETRKDQIEKIKFSIKPADEKKEADATCKEIEEFLKCPDGENGWSTWMRALLEELFVTDAPCIYPWLTNGGTPYRLELMDGAMMKRVLNERGRTPDAPQPAYQQIMKGMPTVNYTKDELVYAPRNKRVNKIYGFSPVEQIVVTVNIAIRRALYQLQYYTEGSAPDLIFACPPEWQMAQIKEFNDWWQDSLSGNTSARRKAQFVPNGVTPINTKEAILKDDYDEWLARIICYCFSVSPQAFIKQMNRSTAETAQEMALQEGLQPILLWIEATMNGIIAKYWKRPDICFKWQDQDVVDPVTQNKMDDINLKNGSSTLNEIRSARGDEPIGPEGDVHMVLVATGYVPVVPDEPDQDVPVDPLTGLPIQGAAVAPVPGTQAAGTKGPAQPVAPTVPPAAVGGTGKPVGKIQKSRGTVKPINRDRKSIQKLRDKTETGVKKIFASQLAAIQKHLRGTKKADTVEDPLKDFDWDAEWVEFYDLFGKQLALTAGDGVVAGSAQIHVDDPDMLSLANENAIAWAKDQAADLVGRKIDDEGNVVENPDAEYNINDATREFVRTDVATAMEEGWSNDKLADTLAENYAFSDNRAMTIARTETAFADVKGNLLLYSQSGEVESKQWIVGADCCDECEELADEVVSLDDNFSNGVDGPPAHPNCRCDVIPILTDSKPSEEDDGQD